MAANSGSNPASRPDGYTHSSHPSIDSFDTSDFSPADTLIDPRTVSTGNQRFSNASAENLQSRSPSISQSSYYPHESTGISISDAESSYSAVRDGYNPPFIYTITGQSVGESLNTRAPELSQNYTPRPNPATSKDEDPFFGVDHSRPSFQTGNANSVNCPSRRGIWLSRTNHVALTLLFLSLFSTVFSGLYLLLAIMAPRYEQLVLGMSYSTAQVVLALFAKLIEMSFVTVFVAFIGQVVSRRAFKKKAGRGVSLAEISMRAWVMQPGTMLTNISSVRNALFTVLGVISFIAAIAAMLYTTASNALVAPQLNFGDFKNMNLYGKVLSQWSNVALVEQSCQTPISQSIAEVSYTCLAIQYAAQSYYNYQQYISSWDGKIADVADPTDLKQRPPGFAALNENTTVIAPWVEVKNMTDISKAAGRTITNVSMALPHAGVYQAAIDGMNKITQPEGLDGLGAYVLYASVPSPVINTLCVNMSREELAPIVYEAWPNADTSAESIAQWPSQAPVATADQWLNATSVDDIFGFGESYNRRPPLFPVFPIDYNTVANNTGLFDTQDHLYILGKGGSDSGGLYNLCAVSATLTPFCSTRFNATSNGGSLSAHCEDPNDDMQYIKNVPDAASGNRTLSPDWVVSADLWSNSLSLDAGTYKGNASNARFLTELIPQSASFDPRLPSMAEALTVMAGNVALDGTMYAPFTTAWNYTGNETFPAGITEGNNGILNQPLFQHFKASLKSQSYASGGVQPYQRAFYIILVALFLGNLLVLFWFIIHNGLVTDWCEPSNLFSISINSPPSQAFAGSCGGGPTNEQYKARWFVNIDGEHIFLENGDVSQPYSQGPGQVHKRGNGFVTKAYSKLSSESSFL